MVASAASRHRERPTIVVVEDDPLVLLTFAREIHRRSHFEPIPLASGDEALRVGANLGCPPAGLVVDIRLKEPPDGIELARLMRERFGRIPVLIVTGATALDADTVYRMHRLGGGRAFCRKPDIVPDLCAFLEAADVLQDLEIVDAIELAMVVRDVSRSAGLSDKEARTLRHLVSGKTRHQISIRLAIPENTVKRHISCILEKTRKESVNELRESLQRRAAGVTQSG